MTIRTGQEQRVFRELDAEQVTAQLTAMIDGLGIQVLTCRPGSSVATMRRAAARLIERHILRHV